MTLLTGRIATGSGVAGQNLAHVLPLIETRSRLSGLIPNTLNVQLAEPYTVVPHFVVTRHEYNGSEELRFRHCRLAGVPCLIMRPDSHETGAAHGPAHLELMSTLWLRKHLSLTDGSAVSVET